MITIEIVEGLLVPFLGTVLGASMVFFLRQQVNPLVQKGMTGFAAGVMVAAGIWSLLIPAMEASSALNDLAFLPAVIGFWLGTLFLLLLDKVIPHLHQYSDEAEGMKSSLPKTTMMILAVTLHNIPEGMAVGVVLAGWQAGAADISLGSALAMSLGIAIQNFPEGAVVALPLKAEGFSSAKSFLAGVISGVVEPLGGLLTIIAAEMVIPVLPYFLAFAAGAMFYVVVEELIPEMSSGSHSNVGVITFAAGFTLMMTLDVVLG